MKDDSGMREPMVLLEDVELKLESEAGSVNILKGINLEIAAGETVSVVGPLCTPLDLLGDRMELARADVGDLAVVLQSGAYGLTSSPLAFLGHPPPGELPLLPGAFVEVELSGQSVPQVVPVPRVAVYEGRKAWVPSNSNASRR